MVPPHSRSSIDNLREALDWCSRPSDVDGGLRLADALEAFWTRRHHLDSLARLEPLLALDGGAPDVRARVLAVAGTLGAEVGTHPARRGSMEALARPAAHVPRDRGGGVGAQGTRSRLALQRGDLELAKDLFEESLERCSSSSASAVRPAAGSTTSASVAHADGDLADARKLIERRVEADARGGEPQSLPAPTSTGSATSTSRRATSRMRRELYDARRSASVASSARTIWTRTSSAARGASRGFRSARRGRKALVGRARLRAETCSSRASFAAALPRSGRRGLAGRSPG